MAKKNDKKHAIKAIIKIPILAKSDSIKLDIFGKKDGKKVKLGELEIGQGSIGWKKSPKQYVEWMSWTKFAEKFPFTD